VSGQRALPEQASLRHLKLEAKRRLGVARAAAGVDRRAILQTGRRVRLREALARD